MSDLDTTDEQFNNDFSNIDNIPVSEIVTPLPENLTNDNSGVEGNDVESTDSINTSQNENRLEDFLNDDEDKPVEECTALVTVKERRLIAAQTMFKKSIKVTLKSFLISLSLSFLNLFI